MTKKVDTISTSITADRLFLRALSRMGEERQFPPIKDSTVSEYMIKYKEDLKNREKVIEQYKKGNLKSEQKILEEWFKEQEQKLKKKRMILKIMQKSKKNIESFH